MRRLALLAVLVATSTAAAEGLQPHESIAVDAKGPPRPYAVTVNEPFGWKIAASACAQLSEHHGFGSTLPATSASLRTRRTSWTARQATKAAFSEPGSGIAVNNPTKNRSTGEVSLWTTHFEGYVRSGLVFGN